MNIAHFRADTPGCENRVHLNSAGASLMPRAVVEAIRKHLDLEVSIGGYEAEAEAAREIEEAYAAVAQLIGTAPHRIAFTEHATAAFAAALSAVPFQAGDVILTTLHDYASNQIQYLALARRLGVQVVRAPDAAAGGVDVDAVEGLIRRRRPKLVAVTQIPTNSGLVQDVTSIGTICRELDVLYLVDGCQSIGQMPVDVERMGCDFFSATSRKYLRGPRGAGFLYVSDRVLDSGMEPLFLDLRGADWVSEDLYQPAPDAKRFETWEFAWALVLGTAAAARYATDIGLVPIRDRVRSLANRLRDQLVATDRVRVLDRGPVLGATVTATVDGHSPASLVEQLRLRGINTSSQTRLDAVIDYDSEGVDGALRVSPHYFNDESDLDTFLGALEDIVSG